METMADGKPCRTCTDFKTWAKMQKKTLDSSKTSQADDSNNISLTETALSARRQCPLDRSQLGANTWSFLHTMAAYYPNNPTIQQKKDMTTFFELLAKFYPCHICAEDLGDQLKDSPPRTESQFKLSQWLCEVHNNVNTKLGKPKFDCKLVDQRWRDGWIDGSCD